MFKRFLLKIVCRQNIFKRNEILLIDNIFNNNAELIDNYSLFEYLQLSGEYKHNSFYIINCENTSYEKIKAKYKNIIPIKKGQVNLNLIFHLLRTKYWLDSFHSLNNFNNKLKKEINRGEIISIHTQHGVNYFKKEALRRIVNIAGGNSYRKMVVSNEIEKELISEILGFDKKNIIVCGLSRWDLMKNAQKDNSILFYFTFRMYLRDKNINIKETKYYKNMVKLLKSQRLQQILSDKNIVMNVALHHEILRFSDFNIPQIVFVKDEDISKIKAKSSLLVTDFSSMCFDFMYDNRPVIFFRLDNNSPELREQDMGNNENVEQTNSELYNIFYDSEDVIDCIEKYCNNNFTLEDINKRKNDTFFYTKNDVRKSLIKEIVNSPPNIYNKKQNLNKYNGLERIYSVKEFENKVIITLLGVKITLKRDKSR